MTDPVDSKVPPSGEEDERRVNRALSTIAGEGKDRREMLNLLRNAAIAGPVLMTLKSAPARAEETPSAMASATHASHANDT